MVATLRSQDRSASLAGGAAEGDDGQNRCPSFRKHGYGTDSADASGAGILLELTMTLAAGLILAAMAVPVVRSSVQYFRVRSAVSSITGAIQSTRYRAIFDGCPYNIAFNGTANTFQVASEAALAGGSYATTFSNWRRSLARRPFYFWRRDRLCRRRAAR